MKHSSINRLNLVFSATILLAACAQAPSLPERENTRSSRDKSHDQIVMKYSSGEREPASSLDCSASPAVNANLLGCQKVNSRSFGPNGVRFIVGSERVHFPASARVKGRVHQNESYCSDRAYDVLDYAATYPEYKLQVCVSSDGLWSLKAAGPAEPMPVSDSSQAKQPTRAPASEDPGTTFVEIPPPEIVNPVSTEVQDSF